MKTLNATIVALATGFSLIGIGLTPTRIRDQERNLLIRGVKVRLIIIGGCILLLATASLIHEYKTRSG